MISKILKFSLTLMLVCILLLLSSSPISAAKYNNKIEFKQTSYEILGITGVLAHNYSSTNNDAANAVLCTITANRLNMSSGKGFLELSLRSHYSALKGHSVSLGVIWNLHAICSVRNLPPFETYDYAIYIYPNEGFKVRISNAKTGEVLILKRVFDPKVLSIKDTYALQHYFYAGWTHYFKATSTIQWRFVKVNGLWKPAAEILTPEKTYRKVNISNGYTEIWFWTVNDFKYWNCYMRIVHYPELKE